MVFQILLYPPQFLNDDYEPSHKRMRLYAEDWMEKIEICITNLETKIDSLITKADQPMSKLDHTVGTALEILLLR